MLPEIKLVWPYRIDKLSVIYQFIINNAIPKERENTLGLFKTKLFKNDNIKWEKFSILFSW